MGALTDLKKLVFTGFLEKKVDLTFTVAGAPKKFSFLIRTLTLPEEIKVLDLCDLAEPPTTQKDFLKYILAVLKVAIKAVNDEPADPQELAETLNGMDSVRLITLWETYKALDIKSATAGVELKN